MEGCTNIELKEGNSYNTHEDFVTTVANYAKQQGFQIRLGKVKKNSTGNICKRIILYSREDSSIKTSNTIRNRPSKCCNYQFIVCASFHIENGL